MRTIFAMILAALFMTPVAGVVVLVYRVSPDTWAKVVLIVALAVLLLAIGAMINVILHGKAEIERARALRSAADARKIHPPAPTYTYNNTLVMRHPETGDVQVIPESVSGHVMKQYAMSGYQLEVVKDSW